MGVGIKLLTSLACSSILVQNISKEVWQSLLDNGFDVNIRRCVMHIKTSFLLRACITSGHLIAMDLNHVEDALELLIFLLETVVDRVVLDDKIRSASNLIIMTHDEELNASEVSEMLQSYVDKKESSEESSDEQDEEDDDNNEDDNINPTEASELEGEQKDDEIVQPKRRLSFKFSL